eukprot:TRINITY_DN4620_c0_g1_i1.p1 TRINITY_DN4620_c0_g1~~TRINITY_DN4620_c0_g1_i1.p1  ORF type:complete len:475 (+),score=76.26 TRINITY_DN4620_c0_g1_i1:53-1477(+)
MTGGGQEEGCCGKMQWIFRGCPRRRESTEDEQGRLLPGGHGSHGPRPSKPPATEPGVEVTTPRPPAALVAEATGSGTPAAEAGGAAVEKPPSLDDGPKTASTSGPGGAVPGSRLSVRQCVNGCGMAAFQNFRTCCNKCTGPTGPHARDCCKKNTKVNSMATTTAPSVPGSVHSLASSTMHSLPGSTPSLPAVSVIPPPGTYSTGSSDLPLPPTGTFQAPVDEDDRLPTVPALAGDSGPRMSAGSEAASRSSARPGGSSTLGDDVPGGVVSAHHFAPPAVTVVPVASSGGGSNPHDGPVPTATLGMLTPPSATSGVPPTGSSMSFGPTAGHISMDLSGGKDFSHAHPPPHASTMMSIPGHSMVSELPSGTTLMTGAAPIGSIDMDLTGGRSFTAGSGPPPMVSMVGGGPPPTASMAAAGMVPVPTWKEVEPSREEPGRVVLDLTGKREGAAAAPPAESMVVFEDLSGLGSFMPDD